MCTLTQLLESCFRRTRIDSIYGAMPGGDVRRANLQEFYQLAVSFEMGTLRDLGQFLEHLDALEEKGLVSSSSGGTGAVRIMSIHKSKGLEFPVVFLCGLSRKFNRESLQARILCDKELGLGLSVADAATRTRYPSAAKRAIAVKMAQESLSEEMRVLYVAMTRARDVLIMTYAQKNLASELQDISARMDFDDGALLCQDASCPGIWVVLSAMKRMEAGELHQLGGRPQKLQMSETPWLITVSESEETEGSSGAVHEERCEFPAQMEEYLKDAISYSYPHISATMTPSKQTATNLKGRFKDAEAAELTPEPKSMVRAWRRPSFMSEERSGTAYGTAMHAALQFIRYANCTSEEAIVQEVERLVAQGFLSAEQGAMVDVHSLLAFFNTEIGQKLVSGIDHIREFKFSILDDASWYGQDLKGEQVLLQGVVDCALMEEDGITVLDFKTDRVGKGDVSFVLDKYRSQVEAYAQALSRIYEMPVKEKYLYLFRINEFVPV